MSFFNGYIAVPIYAYKCSACGHQQDVLQKMSDPVLTVCPECEQNTYAKQVTAAGFQLKGSGWYVTDFRNKSSSGKTADSASSSSADTGSSSGSAAADKPASSGTSASGAAATTA